MEQRASLLGALRHWAATTPAAPFVTEIAIEPESGPSRSGMPRGPRTLSYADCLAAVRGMQGRLGAEPCTVVLALPGGRVSAVLWIAALGGGHTLVPCSPEATDEEKVQLAARYEPDVLVVAEPEAAAGFERPAARVFTLAEIDAAIDEWAATPPEVDDLIPGGGHEGEVCLTTSGTTGTPKGVRLRSDQIAWTADQIRQSHRLTQADRGLAVLPFFHINAPVVSLCSTLMAGGTVVIAPRFSRSRFWDWIKEERITWASIVPTIAAVMLQTERPDWLPGTLQFIRTASAPLPVTHELAFEERFGIPLIETYGLSEAASTVAANPVPPGRHKPGAVGLPVGVELRICKPNFSDEPSPLHDVAPGAEGEVCVSGPNVISGYDGGIAPQRFQDGWYRTGDLGWRDADGYLHISGRIGDVINRGGEKIAPREIEEVLLTHPDVRDVAIVARPDPIYGQQPVAYVVPARPEIQNLAQRLRKFCAERLSAYKVPSDFVETAQLPRTRTGKIQRHLVGLEPRPVDVASTSGWRSESGVETGERSDREKGAASCD